ncbi:MAG TPA: class I SAM-dependent methyltransferase [Pseudonocardiaceae bacterium]|jgi:SAM-dependent methyltransferase|nr:class I SAM-dependent methyltransferase [Pseudonocardiaceae bacterium]
MTEWQWDSTLYQDSAPYYVLGRVGYPVALADTLVERLGLDGSGRLLDVGCGPGSLTLLLARHFAQAVGVDADQGMLDVAAGRGAANVSWVRLRAEELPGDLGMFRMVTFAQSFHWFDRDLVAATVRGMLDAGGACVHVHAITHQGVDTDMDLPYPRPPHAEITELVRSYLGSTPRAGRSSPPKRTAGEETGIYRRAGFAGPERFVVPGWPVIRTVDDVVAATFSLSGSTPHLFGADRAAFEAELRVLLDRGARDGRFSEWMREIAVDIWRP